MSTVSSSDCVKVAVRVRPFIQNEQNRGCVSIIEKTPNEPQLTIGESQSTNKSQDLYTFNNVFMPEDPQEKVYNECVKPMVSKLFEGYNVTILAYGQTGSGKTYTMGTVFDGFFDNPDVGIIPRALNDIFATVRKMEEEYTVAVTCAFMELYQENLYDLLTDRPRDQAVCDIREDGIKGIYISGLTEKPANDLEKASKCLMQGGSNRSVGATAMNDVSSRSHAIFTVTIKATRLEGDGTTHGKFHLVDLAGSERSKKTKATGTRFKEGVKINQGLLALGNVISALGGGSGSSTGFISYRDSKLTRLLQDSLGGNSVTLMLACVSPADYNIEETLSTLRYADRAKRIKNKPVKNEDSQHAEILRLKQTIQELRMKLLGKDCSEAPKVLKNPCDRKCTEGFLEKNEEIQDLRQKLCRLIYSINELTEIHNLEDAFINDLVLAFDTFRDRVLSTCSAEFAMPDTKIFDELKEQSLNIEQMIRNYKQQIQESPGELAKLTFKQPTNEIDKQKYQEFTSNQIEMFTKITALDRDLKIKQQLLDRKNQNAPVLNEETDKSLIEYANTVKTLENELEELRSSNASSTRRDHNATKINMDRKHKIEELEKSLNSARKKCITLEKTKKIAEQDKKRVEGLKREIQDMKTARVQLLRQQRSESDNYKRYIANRDKEINCLKEKEKKVQNSMKRMERLHEKQQAVLKRKVEEAKAINRRLQDAVDKNRVAQKQRNDKGIEKTEVVQNYLSHEMNLLISCIDVKITMQSLMNDRGLLVERLQNLKSTVNKSHLIEEEIKQLEEDLDMRNAQITDMRSKLVESDIEAKVKAIPENFNTVPALRIAMNYILRALMNSREDFIDNKTKCEDLKLAYESSEERIEQLLNENLLLNEEHRNELDRLERDYEQKITILCQKQSGTLHKSEEDKCFENITLQLKEKIEDNVILKKRIEILEKQLIKPKISNKEFASKNHDGTFTIANSDEDDDDEFIFDDSFNDPDWQKTPITKHPRRANRTATLLKDSLINRIEMNSDDRNTNILMDISELSDISKSLKRTSNGQTKCACKGSCATRNCGCKKIGSFCSESCKCSDACVNLILNASKESTDENDQTFKKPKVEREDCFVKTPEKNGRKTDFNNITTPYYPYESKKRRPLLPID